MGDDSILARVGPGWWGAEICEKTQNGFDPPFDAASRGAESPWSVPPFLTHQGPSVHHTDAQFEAGWHSPAGPSFNLRLSEMLVYSDTHQEWASTADSHFSHTMCGECGAEVGELVDGKLCPSCLAPMRRDRGLARKRPCKGKRDRYRKFVSRVMSQIETCESFALSEVDIPRSIATNEELKAKFISRIKKYAEQSGIALPASMAQGAEKPSRASQHFPPKLPPPPQPMPAKVQHPRCSSSECRL
mmetsp:Transcript_162574/g.521192  ORF Transcript_162574/g.521192 Transcript_162574/m.521192 type:complete len:245 (+) Transcript_162574:214-948(+)